jgi:hypothetical protein
VSAKNFSAGFSLIELIIAVSISMGTGLIVFQMFRQNERVFRDQSLIIEAQQTARVVASQIADEIRMAGQGVPVYASTFDAGPSEAVAVILPGSTASRINFRAGMSNVETQWTDLPPLSFQLDTPRVVSAANTSFFTRGRMVYIWGPAPNDAWTWIRGELAEVSNGAGTLTVIARQAGSSLQLTGISTISQEETVSFYVDSGSIRRSGGSIGSEIGRFCTVLQFTYYDGEDHPVTPDTLENRLAVQRVDIRVVIETSAPLTNGTRPVYELSLRTIPRNVKIR